MDILVTDHVRFSYGCISTLIDSSFGFEKQGTSDCLLTGGQFIISRQFGADNRETHTFLSTYKRKMER